MRFNRRELAGAVADVGVLVPIAVALIVGNGLSATAVLLPAGLLYVTAALVYRLPVPVQPLKAFGAIAIAKGLGSDEIAAGALLMGVIFLTLGRLGLLDLAARTFPRPLIRGVQLTVGLLFLKIAWGLVTDPPKSFSEHALSADWALPLALLTARAGLRASRLPDHARSGRGRRDRDRRPGRGRGGVRPLRSRSTEPRHGHDRDCVHGSRRAAGSALLRQLVPRNSGRGQGLFRRPGQSRASGPPGDDVRLREPLCRGCLGDAGLPRRRGHDRALRIRRAHRRCAPRHGRAPACPRHRSRHQPRRAPDRLPAPDPGRRARHGGRAAHPAASRPARSCARGPSRCPSASSGSRST